MSMPTRWRGSKGKPSTRRSPASGGATWRWRACAIGWRLLHSRLARGAQVVLLDNRFVAGSSTPISRRDADGNTYQQRTLDDGSVHEVLKNFPDRDAALAASAMRVRDVVWREHTHYWVLSYTLA